MATIAQTFEANFTPFLTAVRQAEDQLKSFAVDSSKIETQLGRMTDSFSGQKVIQQANLMAEAVDRVGGVSTLTQAELRRVGAAAEEALEKARLLGIEVPQSLEHIAGAAREANGEAGLMGEAFNEVGQKLIGMFAAERMAEFVKSVIEGADAVQKMKEQTGMTAPEVEKLAFAADSVDVSVQTVVAGMQTLTEKMGDPKSGVRGAIEGLVGNFDDFKQLRPYDQFREVTAAMSQMTDESQRDYVANELFKKSWKELLPLLKHDMDDLTAGAVTMGDHYTEVLHNMSAEWRGGWANFKASAGITLGVFSDLTTAFLNFERTGSTTVEPELKRQADAFTVWALAADKADAAADKFNDTLNKDADKRADAAEKEAAKAKAAADKWRALVADVNSAGADYKATLDQMDGAVVSWSQHLLQSGVPLDKVREYYALTSTQANALEKSLKAAGEQMTLQQAQVSTTGKLWADYYTRVAQQSATTTDQQIADVHKWETEQVLAAQKAHTDTAAFYDALRADVQARLDGIAVDWKAINNTITTDTQKGLQQIADKAQATYLEAVKHTGEWKDSTIQAYRDSAEAAQRAADTFGAAYDQAGTTAAGGVKRVNNQLDDTKKKANDAVDAISGLMTLESQIARNQAAAAMMGGPISPGSSRGDTSIGQMLGSSFGFLPARASGGPVTAGSPYLVGERGPELFIPLNNGAIVPNGASVVVSNTFHLVDTESNLARRVSDLIGRSITQARRLA